MTLVTAPQQRNSKNKFYFLPQHSKTAKPMLYFCDAFEMHRNEGENSALVEEKNLLS